MALFTGTDNADTLVGTEGDDTIIGNAGNDSIEGGGNFDIAAYWTSPFGIVARLFANTVDNDGFGGTDILSNIEGIAGSGHDDLIYGSDLGNYVQGFTGNDTIYGLGGDDLIRVSEGNDYVDGGTGTDRMFFLGARSEYTVTAIAGGFQIVDSVAGRDGTDTVLNIERFQFTNTMILAADILNPSAPGDGIPYGGGGVPTPPTTPTYNFAAPNLVLGAFGAGPGAGGWESNDRFPREVADVNGDGRADIVGFGTDGMLVSLANGAGGFGAINLALGAFGAGAQAGGWQSNEVFPRQLADVNGDGRADVVGFGLDGVLVSLANGAGGFGPIKLALGAFGAGAQAGGWQDNDLFPRHLADVNGDGRADVVGFGLDGVLVALGNASGGFGAVNLVLGAFGAGAQAGGWQSDDLYPRQLADVNGDGRADIVGFGIDGVLVALGNASGGFGPVKLALGAFGAGAQAGGWESDDLYPRRLADVNGDGRADVVGFGKDGALVALADAAGNFGAVKLALNAFGTSNDAGAWTSNDIVPRHLADVNADGRADIIGFDETGVFVAISGDVWT